MLDEFNLIQIIEQYGYLAIFVLIFLQEWGVPMPIPNEIGLLFIGYLSSTGTLEIGKAFLVAVSADVIGTSTLYLFFYFFSEKIHLKLKRFINEDNLHKIQDRLERRGRWGIFIARLIPYVRGYSSVAAGILAIKPKVFIPMVMGPAMLWAGGYLLIGQYVGKRWSSFLGQFNQIHSIAMFLGIIFLAIFLFKMFYPRTKKSKTEIPQ